MEKPVYQPDNDEEEALKTEKMIEKCAANDLSEDFLSEEELEYYMNLKE